VRSAKAVTEWENMVHTFWSQYNLVYRGETTDRRATLFRELLPENLNVYDEELSEHFDNVYGRYNEFLRECIQFYGDWFLDKSKTGQELMAPLARQRVPPPKNDDIPGPNGLVFKRNKETSARSGTVDWESSGMEVDVYIQSK